MQNEAAGRGTGFVYVQTNEPEHNRLLALRRVDDGTLTLAGAYESATRKQWTQPIGFVHALFEIATDVLKRTPQLGDAKAVLAAIAATNLDKAAPFCVAITAQP